MASTTNFVDEVYDQFLVCRMCSEPYKHPKVLTCLHTFCCECLENHYDMEEQERPYRFLLYNRAISCPICRQKSELPTGGIGRLPDNFLVENLGNVIKKRMPSSEKNLEIFCEICRETDDSGKQRIAVTKCLDCVKHLCVFCSDLHKKTKVTQFHALFDMQIERSVQCKTHPEEIVKYFCESCDECVCILCAFHQHKDHEVSTIAEVLEKSKDSFSNMLNECNSKINDLKHQIDFIEQCDISLKKTEEKIRESATETIATLRQKEREMISSLKTVIGQKTIDLISQKDVLEDNLKRLENTYKLTNMVAETNNIELLIAKKDLKEQLLDILHNSKLEFGKKLIKNEAVFADKDYFENVRKSVCEITLQNPDTRLPTIEAQTSLVLHADNIEILAEPVEDKHKKSFAVVKPTVTSEDKANETEVKVIKSSATTWQKVLPVVDVVQNIIPVNYIILKHFTKQPEITFKDAFTQMLQVITADKSISTVNVLKMDRETTTVPLMVMHKGVSTVTLGKSDKSTITSAEVSNVYRNVASVKRQVTVSRGTNTIPPPVSDVEPGPSTTITISRACSPIIFEYVSAKVPSDIHNAEVSDNASLSEVRLPQQISDVIQNDTSESKQVKLTNLDNIPLNKFGPCVGENFSVKINSMFLKPTKIYNCDNNATNAVLLDANLNNTSMITSSVVIGGESQNITDDKVNEELQFLSGQLISNNFESGINSNFTEPFSSYQSEVPTTAHASINSVGSLQKPLILQTSTANIAVNTKLNQFTTNKITTIPTKEPQLRHQQQPQYSQQVQQPPPQRLQQQTSSAMQAQVQQNSQPHLIKQVTIPQSNSSNKLVPSSNLMPSSPPTQMGSKIAFLSEKLQNQSDSRSQSLFSSLSRHAKPLSSVGTSTLKSNETPTSTIPTCLASPPSTPKLLPSGEEIKANT